MCSYKSLLQVHIQENVLDVSAHRPANRKGTVPCVIIFLSTSTNDLYSAKSILLHVEKGFRLSVIYLVVFATPLGLVDAVDPLRDTM
jgi:hypothetical protein